MDISIYKPNSLDTAFVHLVSKRYGNYKNFDYLLSDLKKSFDFCIDNKNISLTAISGSVQGELCAYIALIQDVRLPVGEAFFGFAELPDNPQLFDQLWKHLLAEAKKQGISLLKGPVNGSVWHQYRCVKDTDSSPLFKGESFSDPDAYTLFASRNPIKEICYLSAYREPFDIVLQMIDKSHYDTLVDTDFSIIKKEQVTPHELHEIVEISKIIFKKNWGYTELTEEEFIKLYSPDKIAEHLNSLYLLYKKQNIIGFCSTFKEDTNTLILKTIGILPHYQGLGLGNALAYKIHFDAKSQGFKKIIYALIREDNNIKNFPKDNAVIFRRYATFEFQI